MTNDYHLVPARPPRHARRHEDRKVTFTADSNSPWRKVGDFAQPILFVDQQHFENSVFSILTRDRYFMGEIAKNKSPTYAVVEFSRNQLVVKLINENVVRDPASDLLTTRGYDPMRYVVLKFDPAHKLTKKIKLTQDNMFILDLFSDQVFDRMVSLKDLHIGTIDNSLRD